MGKDFLTPTATNYRARALYRTYDVAHQLRTGANRIGVMVGNGLFNVPEKDGRYWASVAWESAIVNGDPVRLAGRPQVIAQLEIEYSGGDRQMIASDPSWLVHDGPIEFSGWYGGEDFDARNWPPDWDRPEGDLTTWRHATTASSPPAMLSAQFEPPVRAVERLAPQYVREPEPGVHVFDFGTNFVGWPELTVRGPAGTTITLRPGWYLAEDGSVSQAGMAGWKADADIIDTYTLAGHTGDEVWHPRFSYHGFRYLEVRGLPAPATVETVTGIVLHAANPVAGLFHSSHPLLNDIHRICRRSARSAMLGPLLPADPNREKAGWGNSSACQFEWYARSFDFAAYTRALARDCVDGQRADGEIPGVVPDPTGHCCWPSCMVLGSWTGRGRSSTPPTSALRGVAQKWSEPG